MNDDEFIRQLDRWLVLMREEALELKAKGVGPADLMRTATIVADARLSTEVRKRQELALQPAALTAIASKH